MAIYIYCLNDPITKEVKYVGQTSNPYKRLYHHLSDKRDNGDKYKWIESLKSKGLRPILEILEEVDKTTATEKEEFYIKKYRDIGFVLFNRRLDVKIENVNITAGYLFIKTKIYEYKNGVRLQTAICDCICGKEYKTAYGNLVSRPNNRSCGCMLNKTRKLPVMGLIIH